MIQRAGRIDRLGTDFQRLWIMNMFPEDGLEKLLGLVESLSQKIADIDRNGLLDASILGEAVHPQNFNTLRRIAAEDGSVLMEQEQFSELVSSEFLLQNLKGLLNSGLRQSLEELPDGIHSGLGHQGAKGVFFAFTAPDKDSTASLPGNKPGRKHYWRYIDLFTDEQGGRIEENRYILTNLIHCHPDTMRVVPLDGSVDIFALQEKVIASILQASIEQRAIAEAPKLLDPIQQTVIVTIRSFVHSPLVSREEVVQALRRLKKPLPGVYLKALRKAYDAFLLDKQVRDLLVAVQNLDASMQSSDSDENAKSVQSIQQAQSKARKELLKREDLRLVCFEYIWH
jgi:hypothetical protein